MAKYVYPAFFYQKKRGDIRYPFQIWMDAIPVETIFRTLS